MIHCILLLVKGTKVTINFQVFFIVVNLGICESLKTLKIVNVHCWQNNRHCDGTCLLDSR